MLFNWSHKKPINPLPPLSLSHSLILCLFLSVKSPWMCVHVWHKFEYVLLLYEFVLLHKTLTIITIFLSQSWGLKSFRHAFRCVSVSINRQIKNGVWSYWKKKKNGGTTVVWGSMWSLFFASSFSEYRDFDNIFAPRKIATVGRNIGSVRLRPFKFQWQ